MLSKVRQPIIAFIDFFHKLLFWWMPNQTFRYIACGGTNTVLGLVLFSLIYNFGFHGVDASVGHLNINTRVATVVITTCINVPIGYILSSYIVFPESQIHSRVQMFRYLAATLTFFLLTYVFTKTFAIIIPFVRADVANIFVSVIIAFLSYLSQRFYTFKVPTKKTEYQETDL